MTISTIPEGDRQHHPANWDDARNRSDTRSLYSALDEPSCLPSTSHSKNQLTTASLELLSKPNSILTFHAKIVPQISIEAYLLRILKYCPTSNGVFLSTLIYLDRLCTFYHRHCKQQQQRPSSIKKKRWNLPATPLAPFNFHFVIDSWNVHRFLIASITAASKLLSDVFYTNSRYAKVGGLPLEELEELEIKFLLMSDFRLMISASEFEDYTERLLGPRRSGPSSSSCVSTTEDEEEWDGSRGEESVESDGEQETDTDEHAHLGHTPVLRPHPDTLIHSSSADSVSSCNSSERSSCSTITPNSPPPPQPPPPTTTSPKTPPCGPLPTTPRSSFPLPPAHS
ncbi:hypothetical protein PtB15_6B753 [Puccinia triticina]|nr:hypothetical protein PtB15_6B753 [Puccinia triticina]